MTNPSPILSEDALAEIEARHTGAEALYQRGRDGLVLAGAIHSDRAALLAYIRAMQEPKVVPSVTGIRTKIETAIRRFGGIPSLARSEGGSAKIIDIIMAEIEAHLSDEGAEPLKLPREITLRLSSREDGGLRIYSDDLPGLIMSSLNIRGMLRDLPLVMADLLKHNGLKEQNSASTDGIDCAVKGFSEREPSSVLAGPSKAEMREILAQVCDDRGWPHRAKSLRDDDIFCGQVEIGNVYEAMRRVALSHRASPDKEKS